MDELTMLREVRPEPAPADLSRVRTRLLTEIEAERPHRRRRWGMLTGLAVAAAVAATVVLVPWDRVTGGSPTSASADPAVLLSGAAAYARSQPFVVPRPDQFVYIAPSLWLSVDGTHDGLGGTEVIPGCRHGFSAVSGANDPRRNGTLQPCEVLPAYRPELPTTSDAMVAYLEKRGGSPNAIGKDIDQMLSAMWLSPQSKAALFEVAKRIPGLSVVPNAQDYRGDRGIGVRWGTAESGYAVLVFDPATHAYLGDLTLGIDGARGGSLAAGPTAIVDRVGQYPR